MVKLELRKLIFGGKTFCCCLPVRMGVITMSLLGILLGGILSVLLWYEVASTTTMTSNERAIFVVAGLVETFLFAASTLGFVGALVRKQLFIQIYAYFTYLHFILNIAVAGFLFWMVSTFTETAANKACLDTIKDPTAQQQCVGALQIARGVYIGIAAAVLLIEMYGAIIVARYVNLIQSEKRTLRASRAMDSSEFGLKMVPPKTTRYSSQVGSDTQTLLHSPGFAHPTYPSDGTGEFNPYEDVHTGGPGPSSYAYDGLPAVEAGYGGGSWSHDEISIAEKARLRREESEMGIEEVDQNNYLDEDEQRGIDTKSAAGPAPPKLNAKASEDLPRYALFDSPVSLHPSEERS